MKRLINFLILRPALTSKNFTSLGLVAGFFGLYLLAGGKMTWIPKVEQGSNFGTIDASDPAFNPQSAVAPQPAPAQITGDVMQQEVPAAGMGYAAGAGPNSPKVEKPAAPAEESDSLAALRERLKRVDTRKAHPVDPRTE